MKQNCNIKKKYKKVIIQLYAFYFYKILYETYNKKAK